MKYSLSIYDCIGKGYENGWWTNCHCRYRCFKGARNTKKSYVIIGLEILDKIISNPLRNILILRNVSTSNRFSTFSTLSLLIHQPYLANPSISFDRYFKINQTTLTIEYKPTGQLIIFDGMLNPTKITSARMPRGFLTDVYIEEAFELESYEDWRKVDGTIRGKLPDGLFHQITFCFNSWSKNHWLYEHFFKDRMEDDLDYLLTHDYQDWRDDDLVIDYGKGLYLHTGTYKINEFRDKEVYDVSMEQLRSVAPEIYKVEALGMWGNSIGATYPEFNNSLIRHRQMINQMDYDCYAIGIDTGLSDGEGKIKYGNNVRIRSATTMQLVAITRDFETLCCIDEFFYTNENELFKKTEPDLMEDIIKTIIQWKKTYMNCPTLMQGVILVYVDCADIGFRQGLELVAKKHGLFNVRFLPSTKMRIQTRVDFTRLLMAWGNFLVSDACPQLTREITNSHKGADGRPREDFDDHAINANEYAWAPIVARLKKWGTFKKDGR